PVAPGDQNSTSTGGVWDPYSQSLIKTNSYDANEPFKNIDTPVDFEEDALFENGVEVTDLPNDPSQNIPRKIAQTKKRGDSNSEDMQHGLNGDGSMIVPSYLTITIDNGLFGYMNSLFYLCTFFDNDLKKVGEEMIQKFKNRTGGTYTNPILNEKISINRKFDEFTKKFARDLSNNLSFVNGDINSVTQFTTPFRPVFNSGFDKFHGLQILIDDTAFTEIGIENYSIDNTGKWTADLTFTIHDHFGVDQNDVISYQGYHNGFPSWWILQHQRDYIPFETISIVKKRISDHL
ncbi:MAG: DUF3289 family protein, partial [Verrucomicrobiota bacterium]